MLYYTTYTGFCYYPEIFAVSGLADEWMGGCEEEWVGGEVGGLSLPKFFLIVATISLRYEEI